MCRIVISGYYGYDNAGDEAILQSMISEFRDVYSDIDVTVLSADPIKTAQVHDVRSISRTNIFQIYRALKRSDVLISGGGSLFQDSTGFFTPWYYSGIILMANILKKPVFAFAQGIGPVNRNFNKKLLRYAMNKVFGISVRDKRSQRELQNLGINKPVSCTIDPAFLIEPEPRENCMSILKKESGARKLNRPRIGFSVRACKWLGNVDVREIFSQVADRAAKEFGADIVLFPLYKKEDHKLAEDIAERMRNRAIVIKGDYTPSEMIGLYGLMDLNVCVRFHGLVFSALNGIPMVAISYDPKIDSFMDYIGLNNIIRYRELNAQAVYNAIKIKWDNRKEISRYIDGKTGEFKVIAREGIEEVARLILEAKSKKHD